MNLLRSISMMCISALIIAAAINFEVAAQNKIEITVNDDAITSYDISQRTRLLQLTTGTEDEEASKKAAMEELINERLKTKESKRVGISVSQAQIDTAYLAIAERTGMTPDQLTEALAFSNVTPKTLRNRLEADIAWSEAVRLRFRRTIRIRDEDVIAALQGSLEGVDSESEGTFEFDLTQYIFIVPQDSNEEFIAKREREVSAFRSRFTSCEEGVQFAEGLDEVVTKRIGKKLESEISPSMLNLIEDVPVGRISKALSSSFGYELIAVCGKVLIDSDAAAIAEKKNELSNKEGQLMARRYLSELRRTAVVEYR